MIVLCFYMLFVFTDTAPTEIYTLSLHDALPILAAGQPPAVHAAPENRHHGRAHRPEQAARAAPRGGQPLVRGLEPGVEDRKSTRLNSSHTVISYAVFCLKKKTRVA